MRGENAASNINAVGVGVKHIHDKISEPNLKSDMDQESKCFFSKYEITLLKK